MNLLRQGRPGQQISAGGARWWSQDVPVVRIGLVAILGFASVCGVLYFMDTLHCLGWGVSHGWTASYRGQSLKVPFLWMQEEAPAGQRLLVIRRAPRNHSGASSLEEIDIHDETAKPIDPNAVMRRFQSMEQQWPLPGDRIAGFSGDAHVADHYVCTAAHETKYERLRVFCISKDGRWTVSSMGRERELSDLLTVLHNLSAIPDPLPGS